MSRIYLDHNATTPLCKNAAEAMAHWYQCGQIANPSSVHTEGRRARDAVSNARDQLASAISARAKDIVFTSGATESNQTVLQLGNGPIVLSAIEHPSISVLQDHDTSARVAMVDRYGQVDVEDIAEKLPGAALCTVMFANNEVGTIQPVQEIARLCKSEGVLFHVDASQAFGKIPVHVEEIGADIITLSSHKVYGPPGVGALWSRPGLKWPPFLGGGHQERGRRAGTENVAGIVGFGAAASEVGGLLDNTVMIATRREQLAKQLANVWPVLRFSPSTRCLPNTLTIGFPPCDGETVLISLDLEGISVSTGSACSAGSLDPSPVLLAMGYSVEEAQTAIRFSLGAGTTDKEVDDTVEVMKRVIPAIAKELEWA